MDEEETHNIDLDEAQIDVKLCCSHTSVYGLKFLSRIGLSVMIISFSFMQIARFPENDNSIYFSLLSSILGYYLSVIDKTNV